MMRRSLFLLVSLFFWSSAFGVEVTRFDADKSLVWLAQVPAAEYKIEDNVCVYHRAGLLGCGTISGLTKSTAAVRLKERKGNIFPGDVVTLKKNLRSPATTDAVTESLETGVNRA